MVSAVPHVAPASVARSPEKLNSRALIVCLLAALAGLMFGLDIDVISGALDFIGKDFGVSTRTHRTLRVG